MAYKANIPQPTNNLSTSQADLLGNFQALDAIFANDHFTFDDATIANRGFHKQITLPTVLGSDPVGVLGGVVYTKTVSAKPELFFKNSSSVVTQLSGLPSTIGTTGTMTLAGGLILKWGQFSTLAALTTPVTYGVAFPSATFAVNITTGFVNAVSWVGATSVTNAGFTASWLQAQSAGQTCYYIAIGN